MELFDIVDAQGQPTGQTVTRSAAHQQGIRHRTTHLWILRRRDGQTDILLQKRCADKDSFPGCYDISSAGHIPAGQDFVASGLRELEEELGLTAKAEELIFCGLLHFEFKETFHGAPFWDNQVSAVYLLWRDVPAEELTFQKEEIEAVRWMPADQVAAMVRTDSAPHCIRMEELELVLDQASKKGRRTE